MNVARLNMSHGKHEEHKRRADMVKKLREELDVPVAILLDTKGPEIRTGAFETPVVLEYGQKYTLSTLDRPGDLEGCSVTFKKLPQDVAPGVHILIDDGPIEMIVEHVTETDVECRVLNGGPISSYKGINVPGVTLSMPYISEKDKADLAFGVKEDVDFIAASFALRGGHRPHPQRARKTTTAAISASSRRSRIRTASRISTILSAFRTASWSPAAISASRSRWRISRSSRSA